MSSPLPRSFSLAFATMIALAAVIFVLAFVGAAEAQNEPPTYPDPRTGIDVTRLTSDGPDADGVRCISRLGGLSNGAVSWSLGSSRITFSKACFGASNQNGIYLLDVTTGAQQCLIATNRGIWASPTFDHTDGKVYYLDLESNDRSASFGIYTVDVPTELNGNDTCPSISSRRLLVDLGGSKSPARERFTLAKNAARADRFGNLTEAWFAVHAEDEDGSSGTVGARTLVFNSAGEFHPQWSRDDATNPVQWADLGDGDSSIWSTHDPRQIFTNRSDGNGNNIAAVWNIDATNAPLFRPFGTGNCAADDAQVAHSDWIYHQASNTDVFVGSGDTRCLWTRQVANGQIIIEQNSISLNGYLHININPASADGAVSDIEFVADVYDLRGGPGGNTPQYGVPAYAPMLYRLTLDDLNPSVNQSWTELVGRSDNQLAWHRNSMMRSSDLDAVDVDPSGFKPYEPHPQYSPDGRYILWQSNSLLTDPDFAGFECTVSACGAEGGYGVPERSGVLYSDLYVIDQGASEPTPTPTATPTPTPEPPPANGTITLNDLDDPSDWTSWATRGTFLGASTDGSGMRFDYQVDIGGYVAGRTKQLATGNWSDYQRLEIEFEGRNTGGEILVLIRQGTTSGRLQAIIIDDRAGSRTVSLPLATFGPPGALTDITEIAFEFDETSPNPFVLSDMRLVPGQAAFSCRANAGVLTWTDHNQPKYWVYKSTDDGASYQWLGKSAGTPAAPTITDRTPTVGARYQVHYQGIPRSNCTTTAEPEVSVPPFVCEADAGVLTWTDHNQPKYWVYKSTDDGASYQWLGKSAGSPAAPTITDRNPTVGARYQVHYQGIPRSNCR